MFIRPLFRLVPDETSIKFMRGRFIGLMTSAVLSIASVILFFHPGLRLGIDFRGGIVMEVHTPAAADFNKIRAALVAAGVPDAGLQRFGADDDVLIRLDPPESGSTNEQATQQSVSKIRSALEQAEPGTKIVRTDAVGASVSEELFRNGMLALGISLLMILVYIWFRFEWQFAVGAVVTLILDVTKAIGFLVVTPHRVRPGDGRRHPDRDRLLHQRQGGGLRPRSARTCVNTRRCRCAS